MTIYIDGTPRLRLIQREHCGNEVTSDKIMAARSWQLAKNDKITALSAYLILRSQSHVGARFGLSKAMGSQRLVHSLYRDLRAYLGARFTLTANAAKSGDLILGRAGVTLGS